MNYETLASIETLTKTKDALAGNNFEALIVASKEEALEKIKELIPEGASVMNGSSTTLNQIGFVDLLKSGNHAWNNVHEAVLKEADPEKQSLLRKQSVLSEYYLGSAHAVTEAGELVFASNSGSQLPHLAFTSPNIILVVSTNKIVPTVSDAFKRIEEYIVPLEDKRMREAAGYGTAHSKTLILHKENPALKRKVLVILVEEKLGF
jgi:L-lactate utilization protein LutC